MGLQRTFTYFIHPSIQIREPSMQRRTFVHKSTLAAFTAIAAASSLLVAPVAAQGTWPTGKAISYMVPFAAGGTTDTLARLIGQQLGTALGTTVVVENKGGAAGSIGSEAAARSAPDGYTLLGGTVSSHAINISLYPKLGYDPIKSFSPITLIGTNPVVLVEIRKILAQPDMQTRLKGFGMEPADMSVAQIATFQKAEVDKWAQVIKAANIKVD